MDVRSKSITDSAVKERIVEEVMRQESFLVGCFLKPRVRDIVINQWAVVSVSDPVFLSFIGSEIARIIRSLGKVDRLCGIETAGIGIAAASSEASNIPWMYARKDRKEYGSKEAFEGTYKRGEHIVFIDNMCAKGKGMPETLQNAEEEGFTFDSQIVIVDNESEKVPEYDEHDLTVYSLITTRELINGLNEHGYFPGSIAKHLLAYLDNPSAWTLESGMVDAFKKEMHKAPERSYIRKGTCDNLEESTHIWNT